MLMFTHLRTSAQGIFAKLILVLLVGSFVLWGIGDIFRQGGRPGAVASVGNTSISMQEYAGALRQRQEEMRQVLGKNYSPELMKRLGIEGQVLFNLINHVVIGKEAENLGVQVSDNALRDAIRHNPDFQDAKGAFSKTIYADMLRGGGMTEQGYVSALRKDLAANLLTKLFSTNIPVPEDLAEMLYRVRGEQRVASIFVVPAAAIKQIPAPTDKEIEAYYTAHAKEFSAPETRTVSYIEFKEADLQSHIDISEEELRRAYADHEQDYKKPEQRVVEQMLFDNEAAAGNISEKLAHGAHFADLAKTAPIVNKGKTMLGPLSKEQVPAEAADAVFGLMADGTTKPIKTDFGWHIFYVSKIIPASVTPFESVRAGLIKDMQLRDSQDAVSKLQTSLEDTLAGGEDFSSAAEKLGQKLHVAGPFTRDGKTPEGKKAALPPYENFPDIAFSTNEKDHSQAVESKDGTYFILYVDTVTPEQAPPLAEVKAKVIAGWTEQKRHELLRAAMDDVAVKLRAGKAPAELLSAHGLPAGGVASGRLKRSSESATEGPLAGQALPHEMVFELFRLLPHETTQPYSLPGGDIMIATLAQVIPAPALNPKNPADAKAMDGIRAELKKDRENETLHYYLAYLRGKYKVSVNESAISALTARSDDNGE